ncbi:Ltp family lipoprotein [Neobacillus sp. NPDC058068]
MPNLLEASFFIFFVMSPEPIRDQLTSEYGEKFTKEEADYAIAHLDK